MFLIDQVQKLDGSKRWNYAFQVLNLETRQNVEEFTLNAARLPQHRNLNRYRDVLPYDHSRVKLENGSNDYINANTIEVAEIDRKYILCQGPLPDTCGDFWQMVWEQNSTAVIMLNKIIEKNAVKCHPYWPMGEDEEIEFSDFRVTNLAERAASAYVVRDLQLEHVPTGDTRSVKQFHYMLWPDFGVPSTPETFLNFLYDIRESGVFDTDQAPPVIHCSAGIGRSGTFCLVDSILKKLNIHAPGSRATINGFKLYGTKSLELLIVAHKEAHTTAENDGTPDHVNVKDMLLKLRQYRVGLVQTAEQLRFSYLAIIEGIIKLYPQAFEGLNERNEESHKRKAEDVEPPPIPPRKRPPPPEKPPRMPQNPETTAEEETIKQKKMVQHLQGGVVDESSSSDGEEEEILNLSESESENEAGTRAQITELTESDEERLEDVAELSSSAASKPLPPYPPADPNFPIHKPLPPLPGDDQECPVDGEDRVDNERLVENETKSKNIENESFEIDRSEKGEETGGKGQRLLPVLSIEEEEDDYHQFNHVSENDTSSSDSSSCSTDGKRSAPQSKTDVSCETSSRKEDSVTNNGDLDFGNKAREETELRQRQRRDEKNKQTAEMVNNIKRKMKEKELAAARWTLTKKSFIALGISSGLLLAYYWFFG